MAERKLTQAGFFDVLSTAQDWGPRVEMPTLAKLAMPQRRAYQEIVNFVTTQPAGSIACIMAPTDFERSAFKASIVEALVKEGHVGQMDLASTHVSEILVSEPLQLRLNPLREIGEPLPRILLVGGMGETARRRDEEERMASLGSILGKEVQLAVVVGNNALRSPDVLAKAGSSKPPIQIELDLPDPESFKQTFREYFINILGPEAANIDWDFVFDADFLAHLLPNTRPLVASFRDATRVLEQMSERIPYSLTRTHQLRVGSLFAKDEAVRDHAQLTPIRFNGDLYKESMDDTDWMTFWKPGRREPRMRIVRRLVEYVRSHYNPSTSFTPLTTEEVWQIYGGPEVISLERFRDLEKGLTTDLLVSTGIPFLEDPGDYRPEPYIPSSVIFLEAAYGPR